MKIYEIDALHQNVILARQKLNEARDKDMSQAVIKVRTQALNEAKRELEEYEARYLAILNDDDEITIKADLSEVHQNWGYAYYKFGDGKLAISQDFMLGYMLALAEYPDSAFKSIKDAFLSNFSKYHTEKFVKLAKEFRENQKEWVRWPSLPLC